MRLTISTIFLIFLFIGAYKSFISVHYEVNKSLTIIKCPNCDQILMVGEKALEICNICNYILVIKGRLQPEIKRYDNCEICHMLAQKSSSRVLR